MRDPATLRAHMALDRSGAVFSNTKMSLKGERWKEPQQAPVRRIVIVHAFRKKTRKTPQAAIRMALSRVQELKQ